MLNSISMFNLENMQQVDNVQRPSYPRSIKRKHPSKYHHIDEQNQMSLVDMATAIKVNNVQKNESTNYIKTKEEKLAEAKANLDEAMKKLEAAKKELATRQKQLDTIREKMRNVTDPVKNERYKIAYNMLKTEFECVKAKARAAEGEVLKLQKIIELLEAKQSNGVELANGDAQSLAKVLKENPKIKMGTAKQVKGA